MSMQYDDSPYAILEARRAAQETLRENAARRARCSTTWTTKGIGEIRVSSIFRFGLRFIEEPCFTSGMALDPDNDLVDGHFPRTAAGVYDWQLDPQGFYIGCWLFFCVDTVGPGLTPGVEPSYVIHHHLAWEGVAIKDVPGHLLDL